MTDEKYLGVLKYKACVFCGSQTDDAAHHLRHRQGQKKDELAVPICLRCHGYCHGQGVAWTLEKFKLTPVDLVEAVVDNLVGYFRLGEADPENPPF